MSIKESSIFKINRKNLKTIILIFIVVPTLITGCTNNALEDNDINAKNQIKSKKEAYRFIITRISGGEIMDVWKIETTDYYISAVGEGSYSFKDVKGNVYMVPSSEVNIIECNDDETWNSYEEYHWNDNFFK